MRLLDEGGEVRAYGHGDTSALRAAGAFVASGAVDDEGRLDAACTDVHTVVHVGGGLMSPDPRHLVREAEVLVRAVTSAGVQRIIALSLPGADPQAADPVRRAKGEVEAHLAAAELPTVVIRPSLVATPTIIDALATVGLDPASRAVEVAPVRATDLLELIVAFDRARSRAETGHLVVAADGPERVTVDRLVAAAGADLSSGGSLVGRSLPPPWLADQLAAALTGPWWSEEPVVLDGWRFAGLDPAPVLDP